MADEFAIERQTREWIDVRHVREGHVYRFLVVEGRHLTRKLQALFGEVPSASLRRPSDDPWTFQHRPLRSQMPKLHSRNRPCAVAQVTCQGTHHSIICEGDAMSKRSLLPRCFGTALTILGLAFALGSASAQTQARVGTLSCDVSAGVGLILVQKQALGCIFRPENGTPGVRYTGQITEYGVALGAVDKGSARTLVLVDPANNPMRKSLAAS
jgi:hypothetical protein